MLSGFDLAINRGPSTARKPKKHRREKGSVPSVLGGEAINLSSGRRGREFATVVEQRLRPGSREGKKRGGGGGGGRKPCLREIPLEPPKGLPVRHASLSFTQNS